MSWLPGQQTDRHDHGDAAGAFTVVSGSLTEHVLHRGTRFPCRRASPGCSGRAMRTTSATSGRTRR